MGGVLVPASVDGVTHDVPGLREDLLDQDLLPAQSDPLAQVGHDADHQALAGRCPLGLSLRLPALQLPDHRGQLVVARFLVQLREVLAEAHGAFTELSAGYAGGSVSLLRNAQACVFIFYSVPQLTKAQLAPSRAVSHFPLHLLLLLVSRASLLQKEG